MTSQSMTNRVAGVTIKELSRMVRVIPARSADNLDKDKDNE